MKNVLKRSISMFLAVAIIFGSAYAGLGGIDFDKASGFLKNLVSDFSVKTKAASVVNNGTCGNNLTWTLDDEGKLTISGKGDMTNYSSSSVPWYSVRSDIKLIFIDEGVTSIGSAAFWGCKNLESITIPNGTTSIGNGAFSYCESLTSVTIPQGVTNIGKSAFCNCESLASITISDALISVGDGAFSYCESLTSVTIPQGVTSIGERAFYNCESLVSITLPDSITSIGEKAFCNTAYYNNLSNWDNYVLYINNQLIKVGTLIERDYEIKAGTKTIADNAFYKCVNLESITTPDSLVTIGENAFEKCTNLISIYISESVVNMDISALNDCKSITSINIDVNNAKYSSVDGVLFNKDKTALIIYPAGKTDTLYTIPDYVTKIQGSAFLNCEKLQFITIPGSVTNIYGNTFRNCTALTSVTIPDSVSHIGDFAFYGCESLESISIPDSVTNIGEYAFCGCTSLTSFTIPQNVANIDNGTFKDCTSITSVAIPDGVTKISDYAFKSCKSITSITIPESVKTIGKEVLCGCTSLTAINVSENNLNYSTDSGVLFNKAKTSLIQYSVGKTDTSYEIPQSVTIICSYAFYGGTSLEAVTIPDGVTYIGEYAFSNCTGIQSIRIPDSMTNVEHNAFRNCSKLMDVELNTPNVKWGTNVFQKTPVYDSVVENWSPEGFAINGIMIEANTEGYAKVLLNNLIQNHLDPVCDNALETTDEGQLAELTEFVEKATAGSETDYEKMKAISKAICEIVYYDWNYLGGITTTFVSPYDVFVNRRTVCEGYARLTRELFTIVGIPTYFILANNHGYNMAYDRDNEKWIFIDNTWACTTQEGTRFNEFYFDFPLHFICGSKGNHEIYNDFDFVIDNVTYTLVLPDVAGKAWLDMGNWYFQVKDVSDEAETINILDNIKGINVTSIGEDAFRDCKNLKSVTIPDTVTSIGNWAFSGCTSLASITIPDSVTNMGWSAFKDCTLLTSVTISDSLTSINSSTFNGCTSLTSIIIPNGVTSIGNNAFYNCESLASIIIPDTVTRIHNFAFQNCKNLESITIPDSVTNIDNAVFYGCTSLKSITLPDGIKSIGDDTFYNTYLYNDESNWDDEAFYIGSHLIDSKKDISGNCKIREGTKVVVDSAFYNRDNLTSVTIPDSVTYIGEKAFCSCDNLTSVTIGDGVTQIGESAFYSCSRLKYVFYTGSQSDWENISINDGNTTFKSLGVHHNSTDHSYGDWTVTKKATCTSEGAEKRTCSVCTYYETRPVAAIGHLYKSVVTEPTCTQNGYTTHTCTNCGDVYKDSEVEAHGHIAGDWIIDGDSSCSTGGLKHIECTVCGEVLDTAIINPKGHRYSDWIIDKQPTCKTAGSKHKTCTGCGDVKTEAIKVISHDYSTEWIIDKEATCTENGSKSHHCLVCDDKADVTVITKLGHSFGDWIVTAKPTCTEEGSHSRTCSACGWVENEIVGVISHNYSTEWTLDKEATCTENGSKSHHCLVCGDKADVTVITALGHSYGDWVVDKEATCTETGVKFKECTDCGEKLETEEIAEKGHSESSWIIDTEATVYKAGSKHKECTECGEILEAAEIPQLKCSKPKLKSISNTSSGVKITWGKVSGADKYRVYRKTSKSDWRYIGTTSKTYYTDKTAKSGTKYYYAVKARNEAGNSSLSGSLSKYYLADPILKSPSSTKNGVNLKWTKTAGAQGYIIYRKTEGGSYKKLKTEKGVSNLSYVDKSAKKGKKYTYKVKAYYSKTYSAYSNTKSITDKY